MKNLTRYLLLLFTFLAGACADFEALEIDKNRPAQVPASLVLTGVLFDMNERPWSLEHRWNQFWNCNYNYYGNQEYTWTSGTLLFRTLKNVVKMEEEAARLGANEVNPYSALGKFFRAYYYFRMTRLFGDLPLDEALLGLGNATPEYAAQKEIFLQILTWLDEANADLASLISANDQSLTGDFYFNGDLSKWRKVVNSFKLRVLITLSKKSADTDLTIAQRFTQVMNNPSQFPIMSGNEDNLKFVYNGTTNIYPLNPGNRGFDKGRYNHAATYLNSLTSLHDPRVFVVANPAMKKINVDGLSPDDFNAYIGASSGESLADMTVKAGNDEYSFINQKRYYTTLAGPEPSLILGYAEQCFNIAEAVNRGWITGDAAQYYENGIRASMAFYGIQDGTVLNITEPDQDVVIGTYVVDLTSYLAQPAVSYAGNNATGLNQILMQKYLAFFQNSGWEAFFNQKRTGVPTFLTGPGTGRSPEVIPNRFQYPTNEANVNLTNYQAALTRQFGNTDDSIDGVVWFLKD
ncbi:MAG: SusD/RagB family nutrient-binding outer membrane lipoprotein [Cyclobacteriaceae bacterium]